MLEILARKSALFDEYVRRSELKDVSPDAVDVSDVEEAKQVASQAEDERRIIELERRRLGLGDVEVASTSRPEMRSEVSPPTTDSGSAT
jgi:hypothetical protein